MMERKEIVIIGGGLAGLTAKRALDECLDPNESIILEKKSKVGGHAANDSLAGHTFDEGPHILFSEDKEMLEYLGCPTPEEYSRTPVIKNYWKGRILNHPAHLDFAGINDSEFVFSMLDSMEKSFLQRNLVAKDYEEWVEAFLGKAVSQNFTRVYTKKYWRVDMKELGVDWISKRISHLSIEQFTQIVKLFKEQGVFPSDLDQHYLSRYTYHKDGFFNLFSKLQSVEISSEEVLSIDLQSKVINTTKRQLGYSHIISTIPIPELLLKLDYDISLPALRHTSLILLNLVFTPGEEDLLSKPHWIYNYDGCSESSRISFPQRFTRDDLPITQCQVEFYFEAASESAPEIDAAKEFAVLKQMSLISSESSLVAFDVKYINYANIMPTAGRDLDVQTLRSRLKESQIWLAGRYGAWSYLWSVESARSGFEAAHELLSNRFRNIVSE
jgi:protoporphyrinogen oxidase